MYLALRTLVGSFELLEDPDVIPVSIAVDGKPAIASYLYVAYYDVYSETSYYPEAVIGDVLDVGGDTIVKSGAESSAELGGWVGGIDYPRDSF